MIYSRLRWNLRISHISRTVRQALHELELIGAIERKRGLGTFISSPNLPRNIGNLYSFFR